MLEWLAENEAWQVAGLALLTFLAGYRLGRGSWRRRDAGAIESPAPAVDPAVPTAPGPTSAAAPGPEAETVEAWEILDVDLPEVAAPDDPVAEVEDYLEVDLPPPIEGELSAGSPAEAVGPAAPSPTAEAGPVADGEPAKAVEDTVVSFAPDPAVGGASGRTSPEPMLLAAELPQDRPRRATSQRR